ncbi:B3 domain-containing protein Os01g0234100 isoform X3 [Beta vulgaris subsp. vulgaris]|uniref:B3 domain-containing protein Os01g0234100 isoform X3 n=1 Tax=Beta vulgaris subsp. vulgaris TaxID=3555 RepID=UPI002546E580|nr:B3 domain-containing protein Os01g0234100 isoform X3 [Beta vulgaris subsp. vulgaris]
MQGKCKSAISKKELKLSLVAKRLSMLQDDDHENQNQLVVSLCPEIPVECESAKPSKDISDDTLSEDIIISKSSQNRTKYGSHKRGRVISDDEFSEDDRELIVCIQPTNKESKPKRIKSIASCNNENRKATSNPGAQKLQSLDLSDPISTGRKSSPMKRAEEIQANLSTEYPSFVKLMMKSHVSGGFWLGLPKKFCDDHLPMCDCKVVLVDEAGKESSTVYLAGKVGLSGGWRGFSIEHKLLEGDMLVFHLIAPAKFKIYIVREHDFGEVDGALSLLTLDPGLGQQKLEENTQKVLQIEDNYPMVDYLSQSSSDVDLGSEVLDGLRFSDSDIDFERVESFENFNIIVDGLIIDSKFSDTTRKKYYELCCCERSFLHETFLKGLNCNLVVGIISETINIADAIKSWKNGSTSHEDLQIWEKTLKGFELLGMKVDFLLARINQLLGRALELKADESNRLKESIIKRTLAGERMKAIEDKFTQLKDIMEKINFEMDAEIKMASARKLGIAAV